jgi:hypothetical protein
MHDFDRCDIRIHDWSKRRNAMLYMLDCPRSNRAYLHLLANSLITRLNLNGHPQCAYAIQLRLSGIRCNLKDGVVKIL